MQTLLERFIAYPHPPKFTNNQAQENNIDLQKLYLPKYHLYAYIDQICPLHGLTRFPYTVIYCHSNGENLLMLHQLLQMISNVLQVRLIAFDYLGYGLTKGRPTERSSQYIGEQVFKYVKQTFKGDKIIVWGRSIGSGVASYLGAKHKNEIDALIIESGLNSAASVVLKRAQWLLCCCDQFRNAKPLKKAAKVVKLLLIHGTNDEIIPLRCSLRNLAAAGGYVEKESNVNKISKANQDPKEKLNSPLQVKEISNQVKMPQQFKNHTFPLILQSKNELKPISTFSNANRTSTQQQGNVTHVSVLAGGHNNLITQHSESLFGAIIEFLGSPFNACNLQNKNLPTSPQSRGGNKETQTRGTLFMI